MRARHLSWLPLLLAWIACVSLDASIDAGAQLGATSGQRDIARRLGMLPRTCIESDETHRVCSWELAARDAAWQEIANAMATEYRIGIVCEVPVEDASGEPNRCSTAPRARHTFEAAMARAAAVLGDRTPGQQQSVAHTARVTLNSAQSVAEMSFILGEAPHQCLHKVANENECHWWLSRRSAGYEIAAIAIDSSSKLSVVCTYPFDGTPGPLQPCRIREG